MKNELKYIIQLDAEIQDLIFDEVKEALLKEGFTQGLELDDALKNAMDSRLQDLSDLIDIKKYL